MWTEFLCISVLRVASGARVKLASCKSALNPTVVYCTDRSKAVVPVLVLLFVALAFILRGDLLYVLPCVILFLRFSVLLALRLPRLGKREIILVLFVRLFDLCLFGFVGFLFLLVPGKGFELWLWHSLDFSLTFFFSINAIGLSSGAQRSLRSLSHPYLRDGLSWRPLIDRWDHRDPWVFVDKSFPLATVERLFWTELKLWGNRHDRGHNQNIIVISWWLLGAHWEIWPFFITHRSLYNRHLFVKEVCQTSVTVTYILTFDLLYIIILVPICYTVLRFTKCYYVPKAGNSRFYVDLWPIWQKLYLWHTDWLSWGFTAQSAHLSHVERGQFT